MTPHSSPKSRFSRQRHIPAAERGWVSAPLPGVMTLRQEGSGMPRPTTGAMTHEGREETHPEPTEWSARESDDTPRGEPRGALCLP